MKQELTISPSLVDFLFNNPATRRGPNRSVKIINIIEQNKIAVDEKSLIWNEYISAVDRLSGNDKEEIGEIFSFWLLEGFVNFTNSITNNIYDIAEKTKDKILFELALSPKEINKLQKKHYEIEFHNYETAINPTLTHKLKNAPYKYTFEENVLYDFELIFEPYFRDSKFLKIIDPFIYNEKAVANFEKLISFSNFQQIDIVAHSHHNYVKKYSNGKIKEYQSNYDNFLTKVNSLKSSDVICKLDSFSSKKHFERYIYTENIKIKLPGGLDFIDQDGKVNISNDSNDIPELEITVIH